MSNESPAIHSDPLMLPIILTSQSSKHAVPSSKYFVPADWKRYQLSELLNKALSLQAVVPFDFVLDNQELLRGSIGDAFKNKGQTEETALEIEYIESILPPSYVSSIPRDDWVSSVSLSRPGHVLSTAYDGSVSLHSSSTLERNLSWSPHSLPALCACWFGESKIASAGMDRKIIVSSVQLDDSPSAKSVYRLLAHTEPVSSLYAKGDKLLSASWDGSAALWALDPALAIKGETVVNGQSKKRRKVQADDTPALAPRLLLRGHKGTISRAIIDRQDSNKAYTAGWDHSVRAWDLENGIETLQRTSDKVLLDLDQMASSNLLITASIDCTVCIWDLRQEIKAISLVLRGHTSQVSAVRAHPTSALLAASTAFDGTVRIWDARSPKQALFVLPREIKTQEDVDPDFQRLRGPDKALCLDWDGQMIASGGEDKMIQMHKAQV